MVHNLGQSNNCSRPCRYQPNFLHYGEQKYRDSFRVTRFSTNQKADRHSKFITSLGKQTTVDLLSISIASFFGSVFQFYLHFGSLPCAGQTNEM